MRHQLISRTPAGLSALAPMVAVVMIASTAWAGPGSKTNSDSDAEKKEQKANAPELIVVRFYADWCGYCKALDAELDKVREELVGQPVLFVVLDLTDEKTRPQAELLASVMGLDEAWAEHNQRTGFALMVKPGSGVVGEQLTAGQKSGELEKQITAQLGG